MSALATLDLRGPGANGDAGAQAVGASLVWVANIQLGGCKHGALLNIVNGVAALTHMTITRAATPGGAHYNWLVDAAISTASNESLDATASIYTLGAGLTGQIKLNDLEGVQEIGVWAQCAAATTLDVSASVGV